MKEFYGKYRAEVVDINDPEFCGRVRVKCPRVIGLNSSNWALPCFPPGTFVLPKVGDLVWVEFEGGCVDEPIWIGVFYTPKQVYDRFGDIYNLGEYNQYYIKTTGLQLTSSESVIKILAPGTQIIGGLGVNNGLTVVGGASLDGFRVAKQGDIVSGSAGEHSVIANID
jgi:hypothetical protein